MQEDSQHAAMATRKASGRNVLEHERSTVQVKLRLPPSDLEDLDELARRWNLTRSGTVARLVEDALSESKE